MKSIKKSGTINIIRYIVLPFKIMFGWLIVNLLSWLTSIFILAIIALCTNLDLFNSNPYLDLMVIVILATVWLSYLFGTIVWLFYDVKLKKWKI
tara:strand:- start:10117 stop:10398 length:282 start_codon:yes stop_codon:yes gene_type:complete